MNQLVADERIGMWMDMGETSLHSNDPAQQLKQTSVLTLPPLGRYAPSVGGDDLIALYISAKTPHPQACWTLLKYLSENVALVARLGTPTRISIGESADYATAGSPFSGDLFRAYREALSRPPTPANAGNSLLDIPYLYWFYGALDRALQGKDLEQELVIAQDRTTQFLACGRQGTDEKTCAMQVAPSDPGWIVSRP